MKYILCKTKVQYPEFFILKYKDAFSTSTETLLCHRNLRKLINIIFKKDNDLHMTNFEKFGMSEPNSHEKILSFNDINGLKDYIIKPK